jgi:hypothetical protein
MSTGSGNETGSISQQQIASLASMLSPYLTTQPSVSSFGYPYPYLNPAMANPQAYYPYPPQMMPYSQSTTQAAPQAVDLSSTKQSQATTSHEPIKASPGSTEEATKDQMKSLSATSYSNVTLPTSLAESELLPRENSEDSLEDHGEAAGRQYHNPKHSSKDNVLEAAKPVASVAHVKGVEQSDSDTSAIKVEKAVALSSPLSDKLKSDDDKSSSSSSYFEFVEVPAQRSGKSRAYQELLPSLSSSSSADAPSLHITSQVSKPVDQVPEQAKSEPEQGEEYDQEFETPEEIEPTASSYEPSLSFDADMKTAECPPESVETSAAATTAAAANAILLEEQRRQEEDRLAILEAKRRVLERRNKKLGRESSESTLSSASEDNPAARSSWNQPPASMQSSTQSSYAELQKQVS